jgi:hypothetical protein
MKCITLSSGKQVCFDSTPKAQVGNKNTNSSEWMGNKLDNQGFVTSATKGGNRISFTGNSKSDDWINKQLDTGKFGYNPKTGTVVKLDNPVQGLSNEDKIRGTESYAKATVTGFPSKEQQKEISKLSKEEQDLINKTNQQKREDLVVGQNEAALKNPVTYAPGAAFFGGVAAPYITAGLEGATAALELPAVLGSRTLPYLTANNMLGLAGGVMGGDALYSDLSSGYYGSNAPLMDKVARGVETGLNLFGSPGVVQKLGQSMQVAPKLVKNTYPIESSSFVNNNNITKNLTDAEVILNKPSSNTAIPIDDVLSIWKENPNITLKEINNARNKSLEYFNNNIDKKTHRLFIKKELVDKMPNYTSLKFGDEGTNLGNFYTNQRGNQQIMTDFLTRQGYDITKMTPEERLLMESYAHGYDRPFNEALRKTPSFLNANRNQGYNLGFYEEQVKALNEGILKNKFREPTVVRRGVGIDYKTDLLDPITHKPTGQTKMRSELRKGDVFKDEGFLSTSIDPMGSWGTPYYSELIEIPGGGIQSFGVPEAAAITQWRGEREAILPKGLIREIIDDGGPSSHEDISSWANPGAKFRTKILNPYTFMGGYLGYEGLNHLLKTEEPMQRDGGKNKFNFPVSKERQLAEQARQQGDIAVQNKVLPSNQVAKDAKVKQQTKEQQKVVEHLNKMGAISDANKTPTVEELYNQDVSGAFDQYSEGEFIDPSLQLISAPIKGMIGQMTGTYGFPSDVVRRFGVQHSTDGGPLGVASQYASNALSNPEFAMAFDYGVLGGLPEVANVANSNISKIPGVAKMGVDKPHFVSTNHFRQVLKISNNLSPSTRKYVENVINSVEKQGGNASQAQFDILQRLKRGDFTFGPKGRKDGGKNINTTGYLDDSDTKHNPYNIIPSNNITMDGVSIPLMLMPDGDKARVVMPNSGEYNFPNSQYVTEIPLAQEGRVNRKNYQPSKDVIIQDGEFTDVSNQAEQLAAKYRECHEGDLECLGSANEYYNRYAARQAGLPTTWEQYQKRGVSNINAWDVAAVPDTQILYNFNKDGLWNSLSEDRKKQIYTGIPIGATISYMGTSTGSQREGKDSMHKKAGLPDTTHAAKVIGHTKDGFPVVYDYGTAKVLDINTLEGALGGYIPQIISYPTEVGGATFANMNKPGVGLASEAQPYSVIVNPDLASMKKKGKGKMMFPESWRLPIGYDAYEASKEYAKTINDFRDTAIKKLGIDPEYYDNALAPAAFGLAGQETEFGTVGEPVAEAAQFIANIFGGSVNDSIGPLQLQKIHLNHPELGPLFKEYADIHHPDDLYDPAKATKAAIILMNYNKGAMNKAFDKYNVDPEYGFANKELLKNAYYYNNPQNIEESKGESTYVRNAADMGSYLLPSDGYTIKTKEISYPKTIFKLPWEPRPPYKQKGGKNIKYPQPTTQDSLLLYNNQLLKDSFYRNNPNYKIVSGSIGKTLNKQIPYLIRELDPSTEEGEYVQREIKHRIGYGEYLDKYKKTFNKPGNTYKSEIEKKFKKVSNNVYSAGDVLNGELDLWFNPDAPASYFSSIIKPKEWITYNSEKYGDRSDVPMYDSLAVKPFHMRTPEEIIEWEQKYGKPQTIKRTTLEPVESKSVSMLESNFESTPITPMSVDRPMMQPSNEEYNRQYSITIPTIDINKRQVAPRVNRVLGQNRVNPKNQYQRSIDVDTRQLPIMDEYTLNKLRMKLGMNPKGFQTGGQAVKKGPGPFLIPESRPQFKSMPVPNRQDPRFMAYQDSVIQNNKSIEALQNFNKAYNTKQPYVATPENLTDDYKNSGVKQQAKYTNPKNTKNYLQPSKKIDDLNEEQRANLIEAFNTQQEGTPINLPTALYYGDLFNNSTYRNEDIWFDYHTNPVQPYHLAPIERMATKNVSPIPVNDERVLPSMNFPIPTFAGTMHTPTTEGLTIPVPTVDIVKETVPPRVNAKRKQNKVNVGSGTKTKVKFGIDQREILSREDLDSLRGSVGLDPKGYESGGKIIKLSTGKIIKIK